MIMWTSTLLGWYFLSLHQFSKCPFLVLTFVPQRITNKICRANNSLYMTDFMCQSPHVRQNTTFLFYVCYKPFRRTP